MSLRACPAATLLLALCLPGTALAADPARDASAPAPPPALAPTAPPPKSTALAVTVEAVSPVGGAGCFYRGRYLAGVLVTAGSLLGGSMLLYAARQGDPDATVIAAVAYGAMRAIGISAAARADGPSPSSLPEPAPRAGVISPPAARTLGFSYGLSF